MLSGCAKCICHSLQALLEAFDASNVTSGMLWSLIQGWCGDVAAALAAHATDVEPSVQLAANAAAGRWSAVVSVVIAHSPSISAVCCCCTVSHTRQQATASSVLCLLKHAAGVTGCQRLMLRPRVDAYIESPPFVVVQVSALRGEHEHSVYYPAPAPQGSQLHHKLLAAAAGAIMHGQFGAAQVRGCMCAVIMAIIMPMEAGTIKMEIWVLATYMHNGFQLAVLSQHRANPCCAVLCCAIGMSGSCWGVGNLDGRVCLLR